MSTVEDVLHCTNERYLMYHRENNTFLNIIPNVIGFDRIIKSYKFFVESPNEAVLKCISKPIPIKETLKTKHYIKIGEECSICYEPMYFKSNTVLTECGHAFHYKCLMTYYDKNYNNYCICPYCRQDVGNIHGIKERYYYTFTNNSLDLLDDFYNNIDYKIPEKCISYHRYNHFPLHDIGMNKHCILCCIYRKKGKKYI